MSVCFGHLQYQPVWSNTWKTPCLKCYSTTYILRAGKLWPNWMLISLWPLERITLFVTDWLHRLLSFLNKLIAKDVKDSAIRDRWSSKAPLTFTSRPARIPAMWAISWWEPLGRQVGAWMELTLTDAVFRGAAHVEARVTAAVLGLVHLGTARSAAEGRVIHHAPLGRCCKGRRDILRINRQTVKCQWHAWVGTDLSGFGADSGSHSSSAGRCICIGSNHPRRCRRSGRDCWHTHWRL